MSHKWGWVAIGLTFVVVVATGFVGWGAYLQNWADDACTLTPPGDPDQTVVRIRPRLPFDTECYVQDGKRGGVVYVVHRPWQSVRDH